jgi:hypothetical protein
LINYSENIVIYTDKEAEGKYLTLDQLGSVLEKLSEELPGYYNNTCIQRCVFYDINVTEWVDKKRIFNDELKDTSPNLIVAHPSTTDTLTYILYIAIVLTRVF